MKLMILPCNTKTNIVREYRCIIDIVMSMHRINSVDHRNPKGS